MNRAGFRRMPAVEPDIGEVGIATVLASRVGAQAEAERSFAARAARADPGRARDILARAGRGNPPRPDDELEPAPP